eukprot:5254302-Pyramimonas_sp.AAC.1
MGASFFDQVEKKRRESLSARRRHGAKCCKEDRASPTIDLASPSAQHSSNNSPRTSMAAATDWGVNPFRLANQLKKLAAPALRSSVRGRG